MELYDGFVYTFEEEASKLSEATLEKIRDLCDRCDVLWKELESIDMEPLFDDENNVFMTVLYFDAQQITIHNNSEFWKILDVADGFEVSYDDPLRPLSALTFYLVC